MKLKIKVKLLNPVCKPYISETGDWIDLRSSINFECKGPQAGVQYQKNGIKYRDIDIPVFYIPLGVAMELPLGFEAHVNSRSSGPRKIGLAPISGQGIVDNCYNSNTDEWHYVVSPIKNVNIKIGDRICQFRIQLSQKATFWQKLKWLISSGVELVFVDDLNNKARGGLGSSGIN